MPKFQIFYWICPKCKSKNDTSQIKCTCGYTADETLPKFKGNSTASKLYKLICENKKISTILLGIFIYFIFCLWLYSINESEDRLESTVSVAGIIIIVFIIPLWALIAYSSNREKKVKTAVEKSEKENFQGINEIDCFNVGSYVFGLQENKPKDNVKCSVSDNNFTFFTEEKLPGTWSSRIGRLHIGTIPRKSVLDVSVYDKSQMTSQAFNPLGLVVGSPFLTLLGSSIKHEEFSVVIKWEDYQGNENHTIFKYDLQYSRDDAIKADKTAKKIAQYIAPKSDRLKSDERKCPYCAEIIKKEAKVCRYCNREI